MNRNIQKVEDLQNNLSFDLIQNSQDIKHILESIGIIDNGNYGCLFVEVLDGEYGEIYGCSSNIPYLHYDLFKLK
jgi:hypothetical protein